MSDFIKYNKAHLASTQENLSSEVCKQQRSRPACAYCRLISPFGIHLFESFISKLAISEIAIFRLFAVAEQAGLNLTSLETPKVVAYL